MNYRNVLTGIATLLVAAQFITTFPTAARAETYGETRLALVAAKGEQGTQTYIHDEEGNMTGFRYEDDVQTVNTSYYDFDAGVFGATTRTDGVVVKQRVVETNESGAPTAVRRTYSDSDDMWCYFIRYNDKGGIKEIDVEKNEKPVTTIVYSDDGTIENIGSMRFEKTYDEDGKLVELASEHRASDEPAFVYFEYDDEGRISLIDVPNLEFAYACAYDGDSRLPCSYVTTGSWGDEKTELSYAEVAATTWDIALDKTPQANDVLNDPYELYFAQYASNYTGIPHASVSE